MWPRKRKCSVGDHHAMKFFTKYDSMNMFPRPLKTKAQEAKTVIRVSLLMLPSLVIKFQAMLRSMTERHPQQLVSCNHTDSCACDLKGYTSSCIIPNKTKNTGYNHGPRPEPLTIRRTIMDYFIRDKGGGGRQTANNTKNSSEPLPRTKRRVCMLGSGAEWGGGQPATRSLSLIHI